MSQRKEGSQQGSVQQLPAMQRFLDNVPLLFILALAVPGILYILWGLVDIAMVPDFTP